ncbi:hypothetical protein [Burkholderia multivorans]|uniref:hypothetical protein n=1 Tax=Burkholderia multivorans TaxID=87883 RepID=UPI003BAB415D
MSDVSKADRRRRAGAARIILRRRETVHHMEKVIALLLDFAMLPEKSRREFLASINEFLIMSPLQRRHAIKAWKQAAKSARREAGMAGEGANGR